MNDFAVFILTHGRANRVYTYNTLRRQGYTGEIYLIIDDEDKQKDEYLRRYKDKVIIFNKDEAAKLFDEMDNFDNKKAVVYARNACFDIVKKLGYKYFLMFDDDYLGFFYRCNYKLEWKAQKIKNLDKLFKLFFDYYKSTNLKSIALAQAGDYIGGHEAKFFTSILQRRKCMNTFFCSTERRFKFDGRINEDVNAYVKYGSIGYLFLTIPIVCVNQKETQTNKGGLTDIYLDFGTYVKSFYTVMLRPASVFVKEMNVKHRRLHHYIKWSRTIPMIINEKYKNNGRKRSSR